MGRKKQNPDNGANLHPGQEPNCPSAFSEPGQGPAILITKTAPPAENLPVDSRGTHTAAARSPRSRKINKGEETSSTPEEVREANQAREKLRELHQQSEEMQRSLQDMRKEFAQVGEQVQSLRRQTVEAGKEFHKAGQQSLEEARQRAESMRNQFRETQEQLQAVQQLFRDAGQNLIVVFSQHTEQIKQHADQTRRQVQTARKEAEEAHKKLQEIHEQTSQARQSYQTAKREAQETEKKLGHLRQEVLAASQEMKDAQRELESTRTALRASRSEAQATTATPLTPLAVPGGGALAEPTVLITTEQEKPRLGITVDPVAVVAEVGHSTPAEKSGLQPGDVITRVNDQSIVNADELRAAIQKAQAGEEVKIEVVRGTETKEVTTKLDEPAK